tara:strand:- start:136 stop:435 length:300 start_codon:yes stop_codon:yes gene_type:complete
MLDNEYGFNDAGDSLRPWPIKSGTILRPLSRSTNGSIAEAEPVKPWRIKRGTPVPKTSTFNRTPSQANFISTQTIFDGLANLVMLTSIKVGINRDADDS